MRFFGEGVEKTQNIGELHLIDCGLIDEDLIQIGALNKLRTLEIRKNAKLTNAGLKNLLPLRYLQNLDISDTPITPDCSNIFTRLPALTTITVREDDSYTKEVWEKSFPTNYTLHFKH